MRLFAAERAAAASVMVFLLYLSALLAVTLPGAYEKGISAGGVSVPLSATNETVVRRFDGYDAGFYAQGAKEIVEHGWIKQSWLELLWPPGFFVVQAAILWILGPDGPALAVLLVLTSTAWAAAMSLLHSLCRLAFRPLLSFLVPLLFVVLPFFRQYFLRDGIVASESLSAALWIAGFLVVLLSVAYGRPRASVLGGALFAMAAYIRASVDLVMLLGSLMVAVDFLLMAFYGSRVRKVPLRREVAGLWTSEQWKAVLIAIIAFHAATLPYRAYKAWKHQTTMFSAATYYYKYLWQPPEEYTAVQSIILEGGGPVACVTRPDICQELALDRKARGDDAHSWIFYKDVAFAAFISKPGRWIAYRAKHLPKYWFSRPSLTTPVPGSRIPGVLLAGAFLASIAAFPFVLRTRFGLPMGLGMGMLYVGHFVIFLFLHYEVRYLYWLQASSLVFCVAAAVCIVQARARNLPAQAR